MGATLPVLVKALNKKINNFGRTLGLLYGWNTFGAVLGVLLAEIFFIKWFGLLGSGLVAGGLNLLAAAIAIGIGKRLEGANNSSIANEKQEMKGQLTDKAKRLLLVGYITGFVFLALEVIWFRFLILINLGSSLHFALILATVLLGISAGGAVTSFWYKRRPNAHDFFIPMLFINSTLMIFLYNFFILFVYSWSNVNFNGSSYLNLSYIVICHSLFLAFPVSLVSGVIFTMLGKMLHIEMGSEIKTTGLLTLSNTLGGMGGSLLASLIFIPFLGVEKSLFLLAVIYGLLAVLVFEQKPIFLLKQKRIFHCLTAWMFLFSAGLFPFGLINRIHNYAISEHFKKNEKRVALKEGLNETIQYLQKNLFNVPYYYRLVTNSHSMSATYVRAKRYMNMYVYWPVAVHPRLRNAALISFGTGMTAKALTDTAGIEHIDIVDISKDIINMSRIVFPINENNPIYDPRVEVHIEDGRFFLLTSEKKFDLITAEPPPPYMRGVVNLYTQEYFQLIYDRLAPQGIVTYWLPVKQLDLSSTKSILKGFCQVFEHCSLWDGGKFNWMMVGVKLPKGPVTEEEFVRQWLDPVVGREMQFVGFEKPEQFGSLFIADNEKLKAWLKNSFSLADNFPKRLPGYFKNDQNDFRAYMELVSDPNNADNFLSSKDMGTIWPRSLASKAVQYFPLSQEISTLVPMTTLASIMLLHKYIMDPTSSNYNVYLVTSSDAYAKKNFSRISGSPSTVSIRMGR